MGQKKTIVEDKSHLLDYSVITKIAPSLNNHLNEETALEFAKSLYEFTKLIFDQYKNEKEKLNN